MIVFGFKKVIVTPVLTEHSLNHNWNARQDHVEAFWRLLMFPAAALFPEIHSEIDTCSVMKSPLQ